MTSPPTQDPDAAGSTADTPAGESSGKLLVAGRLFLDRYQLVEQLGSGAMASVWSAVDTQSEAGTTVAVKVMKPALRQYPKLVERFRREALAANNFSHPHIVEVLEYGYENTLPVLVMEFIDGPSLLQRVRKLKRALAPDEWTRLARAMLAALKICHDEGIIHRDVKAGNILFSKDGHPKLADFGIAHLTEAMALTRTLEVLGTPRYMAPECLRGEKATEGSDLFSLGRTLIFAATGSPTKEGLPKNFSEPLQRWVRFLLAIKQNRRYADCDEALRGLDEAEAGVVPQAPRTAETDDVNPSEAADTLRYPAPAIATTDLLSAPAESPGQAEGEISPEFDTNALTKLGNLSFAAPDTAAPPGEAEKPPAANGLPWHQHPAFLFGIAALGTVAAAALALGLFND